MARHTWSANDLITAARLNDSFDATTGVHGLSGTVVGTSDTQTLTNKTLTSPTLTTATLNGTTTLGGTPSFDAGSTSVFITTTGELQGLKITGSNASHGPALRLYHNHTTPDLNAKISEVVAIGYDGAGTPADFVYGRLRVKATNVTDTTEEGQFEVYLAAAGAADNLAFYVTGPGVGYFDLAGAGSAIPTLFDEYDDALILREGFSGRALEKLEAIGVITQKDTGSGWMIGVQPMMYLCAGGIYQNRAKIDNLDDRLTKLELALPQGN